MEAEVHGLQELLDSMSGMPLLLQRTLIVRALRKGAQPILEEAQRLAPDDPETTGSRVKLAMYVQISDQTADGAIAKIGLRKGSGFVGKFAEFGTMHQPARPWLRPAIDAKRSEALKLVGELLGEGIEKEMKR